MMSQTGNNFGLRLVLNLEQKDYMMTGLTQSAGIRFTVHSSQVQSSPDNLGLDLHPATTAMVALKQVNYSRLPYPYKTDCMSTWDHTDYTIFNSSKIWPYSIAKCKRYCILYEVIESCKCFHPLYVDIDSDKLGNPPCNLTTSSENHICIQKIMTEFDASNRICTCQPSCEETDYEITMSNSMWPSTQYKTAAINAYIGQPTAADSSTTSQSPTQTAQSTTVTSTTVSAVSSSTLGSTVDSTSTQGPSQSSTLEAVSSGLTSEITFTTAESAGTTPGQFADETTANTNLQSTTAATNSVLTTGLQSTTSLQSTTIPQSIATTQTTTTFKPTTAGTTSASTLASTGATTASSLETTTATTSLFTDITTTSSLSSQVPSAPTTSTQSLTVQSSNFNFVRRKRQLSQSGTQPQAESISTESGSTSSQSGSSTTPSSSFATTSARTTTTKSTANAKPDISENLINLNIYMATLDTKVVGEYAIYSVGDGSLFAALGGVFSLYLGISVLGLFEFLEFLVDLFMSTIRLMTNTRTERV